MSLSSGLNASVAGLGANSTRLAAISDNIANSNTAGYRKADVEFSSLVTAAASGTYTAGGVRVDTVRRVDKAGPLITTDSATDIAIAGGKGMLPVTPLTEVDTVATQRPLQMVATGSFRQDDAGFLSTNTGLVLTGWRTDADGGLLSSVTRTGPASLEPVRLSAFQTTADATTEIELGVNLPADETLAGAAGVPFESPVEYFDALGLGHQLRVVYTPVVPASGASNQWTLSFFDSASTAPGLVAEFDLTFDATRGGAGELLTATPSPANPADPQGAGTTAAFDATTGRLTLNVADGPIEVQIRSDAGGSGLSQLAAPFTPNGLSRNGAPAGNLASLEIDASGVLRGVYDTGQRRALYQIPVATVANPNGMTALDNQAFEVSATSGSVFLFDAGEGSAGEIAGFALQQSSVDIAKELTDMIVTQRAFSSNATVIRTVDEMLAETTSLKR